MATDIPRPWHVSPATRIGMAAVSGCVAAMTDAIVPESIMGKIGKIKVGIKFCKLR